MWLRIVIGVVLCAVGVLWIGQGVDVVHGSNMTGHSQYAVLGAVIALVGLIMLLSARRARRGRRRRR
jgi:uncharacterized membrane protein